MQVYIHQIPKAAVLCRAGKKSGFTLSFWRELIIDAWQRRA